MIRSVTILIHSDSSLTDSYKTLIPGQQSHTQRESFDHHHHLMDTVPQHVNVHCSAISARNATSFVHRPLVAITHRLHLHRLNMMRPLVNDDIDDSHDVGTILEPLSHPFPYLSTPLPHTPYDDSEIQLIPQTDITTITTPPGTSTTTLTTVTSTLTTPSAGTSHSLSDLQQAVRKVLKFRKEARKQRLQLPPITSVNNNHDDNVTLFKRTDPITRLKSLNLVRQLHNHQHSREY